MRPLASFSIFLAASLLISAGSAHAQTDPRHIEGSGLRTAVDDDYGLHVVLDNGRPVYVMVADQAHGDGRAPLDSCYDRCLEEWPLVTVKGEVHLGEGLDPA